MSELLDRIAYIADKEGISIGKLEKSIGASKGVLSRAISNGTDIQAKWIQKIVENYPRYSSKWLLTGKGNILSETSMQNSSSNSIKLPLIPHEAFAGYGTHVYSLPVEDYYSVNEFKDADFLIRVKGDSMLPKYCGGDIVACKKIKEVTFFQWNRIYVIYTESQGILIKRVMPSGDDSTITLVSENKAYQPFTIPRSDIKDIAIVLGAITLE